MVEDVFDYRVFFLQLKWPPVGHLWLHRETKWCAYVFYRVLALCEVRIKSVHICPKYGCGCTHTHENRDQIHQPISDWITPGFRKPNFTRVLTYGDCKLMPPELAVSTCLFLFFCSEIICFVEYITWNVFFFSDKVVGCPQPLRAVSPSVPLQPLAEHWFCCKLGRELFLLGGRGRRRLWE